MTLFNQAFSSNTVFPYPSPPFPEQLPSHNQPGTTLRSLLGFRTARARVTRERGGGPGGLRAPSLPVRAHGQRHSCGFGHPARAFGGADRQRPTAPEGHTPTHSCRKAYRGRLELGRGRTEGRQGSFISFHWDYAFQILKAHHKLSSIWEPSFPAAPAQRLQTRVKQRRAGGADHNLRKMVNLCSFPQTTAPAAPTMPFFPRK